MRRLRKIVFRIVGGLVLVLVVAVAGGFLWLRTSLPTLSGEVRLDGLSAEVEIIHDANGIPHIRAASRDDAYFALGFVHARDRLFQMDSMRLLGAGRLSEVIGSFGLPVDRAMRTLGLYRLAEETHARLPADARGHVEAYAAGVNAYLDSRSGALPPEYALLQYSPEPWKPADSLVWGRLMAQWLSGNWRTEALRAALSADLSAEQLADLWPPDEGDTVPTLAVSEDVRKRSAFFAALEGRIPDILRPVSTLASNAWVLSGTVTDTGKPLLANDPHLGFRAPGLWYLARLKAPGLDVTGATAPGVPFHVLGHNDRIAWGLTNGGSDAADLYLERVSASKPGHYDTPDGPRPFVRRTETISVRGGDPVSHIVRETIRGPVISDIGGRFGAAAPEGHVVTLAATGLLADDLTPLAMMRMNRARDWPEFLAALEHFHAPQQNVVYADRAGNIGFVAAGRVPVRSKGDGSAPVPGWDGEHRWSGFIPFESLPQAFNPPSGRFVNANQRSVPDGYPWFLARDWPAPFRAARIRDVLVGGGTRTIESEGELQNDTHSGAAESLVPILLDHARPDTARGRQAVELVRGWDRNMTRAQAAPLIFTAWLAETNRGLYMDELGEHFGSYWRLRPRVARHMLKTRPQWCDDVRTAVREDCAEIVTRSLERALESLGERFGEDMAAWRWGEAHHALFRHQVLGRIPVLRRLGDIRIESDGGAFTVNRSQNRISDPRAPFAGVHGAGYRGIYDLSDPANSLFMVATGPSGNPLSDRYASMTRDWRDGRYVRIAPSRAAALDGATGILKLVPG